MLHTSVILKPGHRLDPQANRWLVARQEGRRLERNSGRVGAFATALKNTLDDYEFHGMQCALGRSDLITLSGFRPGEDIEIKFVGIRPGEKLYEELAIEGEDVSRTAHPKIGIWQNRPGDWEPLLQSIDGLLADADHMSRQDARRALKQIVPEFHLEPPPPATAESQPEEVAPAADARIAPA